MASPLTKWVHRGYHAVVYPFSGAGVVAFATSTVVVVAALLWWWWFAVGWVSAVAVDAHRQAVEIGAQPTVALIVATVVAGMLGTSMVFLSKKIASWWVQHMLCLADRVIDRSFFDSDSRVYVDDDDERKKMVKHQDKGNKWLGWLSVVFVSRAAMNDRALASAMIETRTAMGRYMRRLEFDLEYGLAENDQRKELRERYDSAQRTLDAMAHRALDHYRICRTTVEWRLEVFRLEQKVDGAERERTSGRRNTKGGISGK